jgi:hypothetical protein
MYVANSSEFSVAWGQDMFCEELWVILVTNFYINALDGLL